MRKYSYVRVLVTQDLPDGSASVSSWHVTLTRAIKSLDPFQTQIYWPAHNVGHYLGRISA